MEIVTRGARLSPLEDFKRRTLSTISGLWPKLLYMAELRSADGKYEHWGHARAHGEEQSQSALAKAHSEVWLQVLRTSLKNLAADSESAELNTKAAISAIQANRLRMIPAELEGGSRRHFNSVVLAVRLLHADRQASMHSTASPPPPPVQ
jgi:hypothetical protein